MLKLSSLATWGAAVLLVSSLTSCEDILEQYFPKPTPTPPTIPTFPPLGQDIAFYALSSGNRLDAYSTANAATRTSSVALTGLGSGETLLAIDFRPATGQLYGVSNASRLYVINQNTGIARAIGAGAFTPAVAGNLVGFDFNPTVDRIRLVTSTGQNLRLNPETGTVANADGAINGAAGATLTGVAYTNNTAGASTTALYAINTQNQQLYLVNPPNEGTVVPVGNLNLPVSGNGGFDIDARTGTALALYAVNGNPTLFTLDLATGTARPLAQYSASLGYTGIAIPTRPVAYGVTNLNGVNTLAILNLTNVNDTALRPITGLGADEELVGLDFRPATNQLYALTSRGQERTAPFRSEGRLYTLNAATGAATFVAAISTPLEGTNRGFDFNPVADRLRITGQDGQNLRVNPTDGVAIIDGRLNPGDPNIGAVAYDNSFGGAASTNLYAIGIQFSGGVASGTANLFLLNPPNVGTVTLVGNLGISQPGGISQFDIAGTTNTGYAILQRAGSTDLYLINLTNGRATQQRTVSGPLIRFELTGFTVGLGF